MVCRIFADHTYPCEPCPPDSCMVFTFSMYDCGISSNLANLGSKKNNGVQIHCKHASELFNLPVNKGGSDTPKTE